MKSSERSSSSFSTVFIRSRVSGPVSRIGLLADAAETRVDGRVVHVGGLAVEHAARSEALLELGTFVRVVGVLGLLFGVQVVEVAEELVEAVNSGQILVPVAEVVLPDLGRPVAVRLQELGDRRVLGLEAHLCAGHADLEETGAIGVLSGDERGASGRTALLSVVVR